MRYIALIGDIVNSRFLPERQKTQEHFKSTCRKLNSSYKKKGLISPITITLGDEFQALFDNAQSVWACILAMEDLMAPVSLRFSLGVGDITTEVNRKTALEMDGPAFHRAREGIERLKDRQALYGITGLGKDSNLVACSLDLFSYHRSKWHFNRVAILAGLLAGKPVGEIQGKLGISEQAVYRNIREGKLETVRCLMMETAKLCNEALENANAA